jgi:hypothetical protein
MDRIDARAEIFGGDSDRDAVTAWIVVLWNGTSSTSTTASLTSLTDSLDDEYLDLNVRLDDDATLEDARDLACARARAVNALLDVARGIPEDAVYEAIASMEAARHFPDPSPVDAEVEQIVRSARAR